MLGLLRHCRPLKGWIRDAWKHARNILRAWRSSFSGRTEPSSVKILLLEPNRNRFRRASSGWPRRGPRTPQPQTRPCDVTHSTWMWCVVPPSQPPWVSDVTGGSRRLWGICMGSPSRCMGTGTTNVQRRSGSNAVTCAQVNGALASLATM